MIIDYIILRNIRSYLDATIRFREGSLLLSGDIGSGKSSILLAAEFALFGIMRGKFSGETLLRGGRDHGEVELGFSIGKDQFVIKRTLKRGSRGVQQAAGYLIRNGVKKEGTAIELKSEILDILGYSRDLAAKSKDLIYRYTVYTPQEAMKEIILDDRESRLDILRKVFGIEKYKIIKDNCLIVGRAVKEAIRLYEGKCVGISEKKQEKELIVSEIAALRQDKKGLYPVLAKAKDEEAEAKKKVREIDAKIEACSLLEKEYALLNQKIEAMLMQRKEAMAEEKKITEEIDKTAPIEKEEPGVIEKKIKKQEKILESLRKEIADHQSIAAAVEEQIENSAKILNRITDLDICPTCEQIVSPVHKDKVREREEKSGRALLEKKITLKKRIDELKQESISVEKDIEVERESLTKVMILIQKEKSAAEKKERRDGLIRKSVGLKEEIGRINGRKLDIGKKMDSFDGLKGRHAQAKTMLEKNVHEVYRIEKEIAVIEKEIQGKEDLGLILEKDIKEKEIAVASLNKAKNTLYWLNQEFTVLMGAMEKAVMTKVYQEFSHLFSQWFNILVEDEALQVRLNEDFEPIAEQNGYETDLLSLSGGERTACALAYRLSLNKVINDVIDTIRTKDLLILDEPTDGFSSEQLDRMRELLDMIAIRQVIIVSHEPKIESFVENIIRIEKNNHESTAITY